MAGRSSVLNYLIFSVMIGTAIFYAHFREGTYIGYLFNWTQLPEFQSSSTPLFIQLHAPSFLQTFFIALIYYVLVSPSKYWSVVFSFTVASALEISQLSRWQVGTFDVLDLLFVLLGALTSAGILYIYDICNRHATSKTKFTTQSSRWKGLGLVLTSYWFALGCTDGTCDPETDNCIFPVVLTWEELREDTHPSYGNTSTLTRPGKVHVQPPYLFVIDEYRGVHIFDQTDPLNPTRIVFLPIKGALDVRINGDYLYVNSFTDLLSIQYQHLLDGSFTQDHITRTEHVFQFPSYHLFVPEGYRLEGHTEKYIDYQLNPLYYGRQYPNKGFIIGYYDADFKPVVYGDFKLEEDQ